MSKKLVIVESPSKSKTIEKYLGNEYKVVSSLGHIRDLSTTGKYGLGIDIENDFKPSYEIIKGKNKLVSQLKWSITADIFRSMPEKEPSGVLEAEPFLFGFPCVGKLTPQAADEVGTPPAIKSVNKLPHGCAAS